MQSASAFNCTFLSRNSAPHSSSRKFSSRGSLFKTKSIKPSFIQFNSNARSIRTMCPCLLMSAALLLAVIYWYLKKTFDYWKDQNVPSAPDPILGFGHVLPILMVKENLITFSRRLYKQTEASAIGFYFFHTPGIVVRDAQLVKSILQTNFSSFHNSLFTLDKDNDPVMAQNPFFIKDLHEWKASRSRTVSHLSGRKLRTLFKFVSDVAAKLNDFVGEKLEAHGSYECQLKEFFERYTGEFVANTAFAIEGESFEDEPSPKSFARVAKVIMEPSFVNGLKQTLIFYMPALARLLRLNFLPRSTDAYFRETVKRIVEDRKLKGVGPSDYLQFCLDETSELNKVVADIIVFYLDTYETASSTLSTLFYLLSKHEAVPEKLRKHVAAAVEKAGGEITYDALKEMTYLDQVLSETLRLMPPIGVLKKICTEEVTLAGSDGLALRLRPGHAVLLPMHCLQLDERYFPEPQAFDPERFSPENQAGLDKFAFLPFGEGPRMCPGVRLAQMLVKLATASLLLKFSVEHSAITKEPLDLESNTFVAFHKGGLWAKFKRNC